MPTHIELINKYLGEAKINSTEHFIIDQLSNSMENYDEKGFVQHMNKQTLIDPKKLKKMYSDYWKLGADDRMKWNTQKWKTWIDKVLK